MPDGHYRAILRLASALLVLTCVLILFPAAVHASCTSPANAIEAENCLTGTPQAQWDISGAGDSTIQGFATDISVNAGQTVSFKINTTATQYHLDIYRMGYYQGNGARLIVGKALNNPVLPSVTLPQTQPACVTDAPTNLVDCGNWTVSASWAVPANAVSGIYFARAVRDDTAGASHIVFIVRNDSSTSAILFQTADETWQAYNDFGGHSLYGPTGVFNNSQRAYKVSYNRPFHTRGFDPASWVFYAEYPMVRWLEANGYDVAYFTSVDAAHSGSVILNHKLYLSVGHDEYWSGPKRTNIEAARAAGVHLAFFIGNGGFWKSRWENSIDGSATAYRTLVSYKETLGETKIDPLDPPTWTGTWRDPTLSPPADGGNPENELTGTLFRVNGCGTDNTDLSMQVPAADGKMRFWRNSAIANQTTGQTFTLPAGTLGYEWDVDADNGFRPAGLFALSTASYSLSTDYLIDYGATYGAGTAIHHSTLYRASSKALVFGAGTVQWSWGLDNHHDTYCGSGPYVTDPNMQQATVNLFADMGVQPATLQSGLLSASASADTTPPVSTITSPASGGKVEPGATVTIQGTAADSGGGVVGGVEVSTDGGTTWHPATGRESWSYTWTVSGTSSATLRSRAVDDSGNLETPGAGVTVTISPPSCPCTIWPSTATPGTVDSGDATSYELGVKFKADFDGTITGIRFYKSAANTGTHIGNLWSAAGSLLGTATFTGESASGWQQVSFTAPIAVTANTIYVASYSTTAGHYSFDSNYFSTAGVDNPPLHALQNGVSGGNGLYGSAGAFPPNSFNSANYWVDVVYMPSTTVALVSIAVTPVDPTLQIGQTQQFAATATYSDGTKQDITSQVTWSSSNTGAVTINSTGLATAVAAGSANLTATLGTTSGSTTMTVQGVTLAITTTTLPNDAVNVPYSATLAATGGVRPYTWSLATGSLPVGLSLSPAGQISGTPLSAGTSTFTVQVKDSGVQEGAVNPQQTATQSLSITSGATSAVTIWPSTAVPATADAGDAQGVELGVRFTADISGLIKGIRFYKSATNTGTHVGNLWTNTGTLLATATFANETASGWQEVDFATPVMITASTVYVASYHTTVGHYSADSAYFAIAGVDNPPLHALKNGVSGANGVFTYDTATGCTPTVQPCFPTNTYNSANYWVDVAFKDTFAISGTISGGGGNGATVTASLGATAVATTTANASGAYSLAGLGNGTYTVTPTNAGFTFTPASQTVTINNSDGAANFASLYSISGTISGTGSNGATVTLSGTASATVTTDATGHYIFAGLANGTYTVTPTNTGFSFTPASQAVTINNANATANFSTLFSLSGTISPAPSGAGTTVVVTGTTTAIATADGNGNYIFTGLPNGSYTVTPTKPGFIFTPASQPVTSTGAAVTGVNFAAAVSIVMDAAVSTDSSAENTSITSPTFSTTAGNELLLAFVGTDAHSANLTVTGVSGAGLTWTLVQRTNAQMGTAEIWRAFAPQPLTNVSVTATLSQSVVASITVVSFTGVNTSGTNGSGAIGATGTGNANPGAPTASLVTTQNKSWVFGVGADWDTATARTLGPNQTMVHQYLVTAGDTLWVQSQNSPTPVSGTTVTINDSAPTTDRYNLSICEILPAPTPWVLSGTISGGGAGTTVTLTGAANATVTADASGNYSFTGLNNGTYTVTPINTGFKYTPASQTVTINGANLAGVNFTGVVAYSISGSITPAAMGSGATVTLSGAATATTTADASGNYTFTGLLNGAYTVTPSQTALTLSPASLAATIGNANVTGVNFSVVSYSVSGTVSGPGGSGATVNLTGTSSAAGSSNMVLYSQFDSAQIPGSGGAWSYFCDHATFTANTNDVTDPWGGSTALKMVAPASGTVCTTYTAAGIQQTISGLVNGQVYSMSVWARGAVGGERILLRMDGASGVGCNPVLTSSWVRYTCPNLTYKGAGTGYIVNMENENNITVYLAGAQLEPRSSVGTYVHTTSPAITTVTADGAGNYTFTGLTNGVYTVAPSKTGFTYTPASQPATVNNSNVTALNFSTVTYSISGTISGTGGNGATVNLTGTMSASTTADASGNYTFTGLVDGAYTVAPSNSSFLFTPASHSVTVASANVTGMNFTGAATYSVSGTISGPGGSGAIVNLTGTMGASATADASGNYTVTGLVNGIYRVTPSNPGFAFAPPGQSVTVASANVTGMNFASTATYSVAGTISGAGGNGATVTLAGAASATGSSNMVLYSQFDSAQIPGSGGAWAYFCDHATFTANTNDVTDPWGGSTALKMVAPASGTVCTTYTAAGIQQTISDLVNGQVYSMSVWARGAVGGERILVRMAGAGGVGCNPFTLTTSWVRYTCPNLTFNGIGTGYIVNMENENNITVYLAGAQLEPRSSVGTYIHTTNAPITMVTADASGNYAFTGLGNGTYTVAPSETGVTYTPASQPATVNNANVTGLNFSTVTYTISGTISGPGGNAATVNLTGTSTATVTADASGNYTFTGLVNGPYTVTPSNPSFAVTPASQPVTVNGANITGVNFSIVYSISGTISGPGGSGATVSLTGASTATVTADSSGNYAFTGLANGAYTVTPSKTGMTYSPASQPATVSNANVTALNFSTVTYSISGTITGAGGNAAAVALTGASTATVTADASGNYTFSGLVNGAYTVTPSKAGFTFTPASQPATINNGAVTALNFSTVTYSISGTISGTGGNGATVNLTGVSTATTTADASGNYTFSNLANGSYTVTPSKAGFAFAPVNKAGTVSGANVTGVTFASTSQLAIDKTASTDRSTNATTIASPAFTTTSANELLLAFVSSDAATSGITVTGVTGGSLTWTLVKRTNTQMGTAEIWRAFAPAVLSNATVTATLSQSVAASITVVTFTGVDTTGTGGSGAIGATGGSNAAKAAPTASLTTTRNNSWVIGVGNDWDSAISRTLGAGQTLVHQYLSTGGDTYWVQQQTSTTSASGTVVTINDTAPTSDRYNLSICEVLPAP